MPVDWDEASCLGVHVFYLEVDTVGFVADKEAYWVLMLKGGKFQAEMATVMIQNHIMPLNFSLHSRVPCPPPLGLLSWSCFQAVSYTN